jgi:hypothetical protein
MHPTGSHSSWPTSENQDGLSSQQQCTSHHSRDIEILSTILTLLGSRLLLCMHTPFHSLDSHLLASTSTDRYSPFSSIRESRYSQGHSELAHEFDYIKVPLLCYRISTLPFIAARQKISLSCQLLSARQSFTQNIDIEALLMLVRFLIPTTSS